MAKTKKATTDFAEFIRSKLAKDPELAAAVDEVGVAADIAEEIYQARIEAGLTQKELAERIGTHQSVIARLEDADYSGHSVSILRRIAAATGTRLGIGFYAKPLPIVSHAEESYSPAWRQCSWTPAIEVEEMTEEELAANGAN